jgi:membrane protein implicated in regulation of membrane protease activity
MTAIHVPRSAARAGALAALVREVFWVLALGAIGCYAFFVALGGFSPGDVAGVSIAIGALLVLWLVHAWAQGHRRREERDPRLVHARERRGF